MNGAIAVNKVASKMEEEHQCGCKRSMYKLILMDCNMPIMDGFTASLTIREMIFKHNYQRRLLDQLDQPYIVALTAYNTDSFKEKCFNSGMIKFLTKPMEV